MRTESVRGRLPQLAAERTCAAAPTVAKPFKRCRYCSKEWRDKDDFLSDPGVYLGGKKAASMRGFIESARHGLLIFVHNVEQCGSTMLVAPEALIARSNIA